MLRRCACGGEGRGRGGYPLIAFWTHGDSRCYSLISVAYYSIEFTVKVNATGCNFVVLEEIMDARGH